MYLAKNNRLIRYPDFYHKQFDIVADAKYKRSADRNDENQMTTYLYRKKSHFGIFINPSNDSEGVVEEYDMLGYGEDKGSKMQIVSLRIPSDACDYTDFRSKMQLSEGHLISYLSSIL